MEDISIQKDCFRKLSNNSVQKYGDGEKFIAHLDMLDAVQMGNLKHIEDVSFPSWMVDDRNPRMVACIIQALTSKEIAFIAPGLSHFVGEKGIVNLLQKQGVTVTRIDLN